MTGHGDPTHVAASTENPVLAPLRPIRQSTGCKTMIKWILHRMPHASNPSEIRVAERLKALDASPFTWTVMRTDPLFPSKLSDFQLS